MKITASNKFTQGRHGMYGKENLLSKVNTFYQVFLPFFFNKYLHEK